MKLFVLVLEIQRLQQLLMQKLKLLIQICSLPSSHNYFLSIIFFSLNHAPLQLQRLQLLNEYQVFLKIDFTCNLTVPSNIPRFFAINLLLCPSASNSGISLSLGVRVFIKFTHINLVVVSLMKLG